MVQISLIEALREILNAPKRNNKGLAAEYFDKGQDYFHIDLEFDKAAEAFKKAVEFDPSLESKIIQMYVRMFQDGTGSFLALCTEEFPNNPSIHYHIGTFILDAVDCKNYQLPFNEFSDDNMYGQIKKLKDKVENSENPESRQTYKLEIERLMERFLLEISLDEFRKATELDPKIAPFHSEYMQFANISLKRKHYDLAEAMYKEVIEFDNPQFTKEAYWRLGRLYIEKNMLEEAADIYTKSVEMFQSYEFQSTESIPSDGFHKRLAYCYRRLGESHIKADRFDLAEGIYRRAAQDFPENVRFHRRLGYCLHKQGQKEESKLEYQKARELKT